MEVVIRELNEFLSGWVTYFRHASCFKHLTRLDKWIRRKLRCYRIKQRKRAKGIADFLQELGVPEWRAWLLALSGKGWWRMAGSPQACEAMGVEWFDKQGLIRSSQYYKALTH
jgi:RNA-directed DNA polymerase